MLMVMKIKRDNLSRKREENMNIKLNNKEKQVFLLWNTEYTNTRLWNRLSKEDILKAT